LDALEQPRRRPADDVLRRVRSLLPAQVDVDIERVDAPRALGVGDAGDRANERRMLDVREERDVLALLEVDPDANGEPRVVLQLPGARRPEGVGVHAATLPP